MFVGRLPAVPQRCDVFAGDANNVNLGGDAHAALVRLSQSVFCYDDKVIEGVKWRLRPVSP